MQPLELALQYMDLFYSGKDLDALVHLFAKDFTFRGPFYCFDTAEDYVKALKADPPQGLSYQIIRSFETDAAACLVYQFSKPGISVPMAQLFEIIDGKIGSILLIFDTGAFS